LKKYTGKYGNTKGKIEKRIMGKLKSRKIRKWGKDNYSREKFV